MSVIHYAGRIDHAGGYVLPGWAACCSGDKAIKIRAERRNTYDKDLVSCKQCLHMMAKHDAYARQPAGKGGLTP